MIKLVTALLLLIGVTAHAQIPTELDIKQNILLSNDDENLIYSIMDGASTHNYKNHVFFDLVNSFLIDSLANTNFDVYKTDLNVDSICSNLVDILAIDGHKVRSFKNANTFGQIRNEFNEFLNFSLKAYSVNLSAHSLD